MSIENNVTSSINAIQLLLNTLSIVRSDATGPYHDEQIVASGAGVK